MLFSLITQNEYHSLRLPERREGRFLFTDPQDGQLLFRLTGSERGWIVEGTGLGRIHKADSVEMMDKMLIHVRIRESMEQALLYMEDTAYYYSKFARCQVPDNISYSIGSGPDCDFVCKNIHISAHHCRLACKNRTWVVQDSGSALGTFVNGLRIGTSPKTLSPGDVVSVLNQRFIILPGLLAFNAQNIDPDSLKGNFNTFKVPQLPLDKPLSPEQPRKFFRRKPRYLQAVKGDNFFDIQAPPDPRTAANTNPALLTMGPTIVSGLAMLVGGMTNPVSGLGMLASSLLFPQITRKRNEKLVKEEEEKRKQVYSKYIDKLNHEMKKLVAEQAEALRSRNPDPHIEAEKILTDNHDMWGRRPEQPDFLDIRLGLGTLPTMAKLNFPPQDPLDDDEDPMQQKLLEFQKKKWELKNVPIVLPLGNFYSVGVTGPDNLRNSFAANMLMQLAMHIGCDDMKLCLIGHLGKELEPLRWLPHTWDVQNSVHLTAENKDDMLRMVKDLAQILTLYQPKEEGTSDFRQQELVILITEEALAHTGILTRMLFDKEYEHVHIIILSLHSADLPSRTNLMIGLRDGMGKMVWQDGINRATMEFVPDQPFDSFVGRLASVMANTYLDMQTDSVVMPTNVSFLDLFGVSDVTHLNILSRWEKSDPIRSLSAPLGISEDGDLCTLDLHEKADGPHGLIAGTTGSGKSELIMAYILSMAINFSPDEVAFVLIDYKGGGMAQAFEHLPHTAGIITNLDGNELNRSLMSINSELQRRQRVFADAKRSLGNIQVDIYKYQQLYRTGKVKEPVSHLLIITDEFAELKTQEPEFMQELIRAARIGRSLGVHLILATQKPSGVVNDQIWSNTNFRICLRVQDASDSREVIKAPDAAGLTNPGSFYKQVGYGVSMTKAQSGYTGADYLPEETAIPNCGIDVLDNLGAVIRHEALPRVRKSGTSAQLKVLTDYITDLGRRDNLHTRLLWEPPLESVILLKSLYEKYNVYVNPWLPEPLLGEADDPANQRRLLVRLPVFSGKNAIIYGALGAGKLMSVSTVLEGLLMHHNAEQLNIYILDFADDGLHAYAKAPQVGDVLFSDDDEKLSRLLSFLENAIQERRKILGGAAASQPLPDRLEKAGLPNILIILHQFSAILSHMEKYMDRFGNLLKDGPRWGITFLATQENTAGIRYQILQRFTLNYVLQMDHPEDYSSILGRTGKMKPSAVKGRGLVRFDDLVYEYQTATGTEDPESLCFMLENEWHGKHAPTIRVMPEKLGFPDMLPCLEKSAPLQLPVGLDCETIEPVIYPFDSGRVHALMGSDSDVERFLNELLPLARENDMNVTVLGDLQLENDIMSIDVETDVTAAVNAMFQECRRMKAENLPEQIAARKSRLFVIPSIHNTMNGLSEESVKYLRAILEIAKPDWKWTFLICDNSTNFDIIKRSKSDRDWINSSINSETGIYLGNGMNSQSIFRVSGDFAMLRQNITFPLGYVIRKGIAKRVRFMDGKGSL